MNAPAPTLPGGTFPTFPCPKCRQAHPWAAEYVGRTARCACGHVLKVPATLHALPVPATGAAWQPGPPQQPGPYQQPAAFQQPGPFPQPAPYQQPGAFHQAGPFHQPGGFHRPGGFSQPAPSTQPGSTLPPPLPPAPGQSAAAGDAASEVPAFLRMPAAPPPQDDSLDPAVEAELAATGVYGEEDQSAPDPKRDLYVPLALLAVGFGLTAVDFMLAMGGNHGVAIAGGVFGAGLKLVLNMVLMLGAALLAAKFAGINFGSVGPALLKLAGLCLAPSALGDLVTRMLGGDMAVGQIGWVVMVVMNWVLISYLFRLDGMQTAVVVFVISAVRILLYFVLGAMLLVSVGDSIENAGRFAEDGGQGSSMRSVDADGDYDD